MQKLISSFVLSIAIAPVTGMSSTLNSFDSATMDFHAALQYGYKILSKQEDNENDLDARDHFAEKAELLMQGMIVEPDLPKAGIDGEIRGQMEMIRTRIMSMRHEAAMHDHPKQLARAQLKLDCWIEEQSEGFQVEEIADCKNELMSILKALGEDMLANGMGKGDIIYFKHNSSKIDDEFLPLLDSVSKRQKKTGKKIQVLGHADRSGADGANGMLSKRRANSVRDALSARGIPADAIILGHFGETMPRVETEDGVREKENRRVELLVE